MIMISHKFFNPVVVKLMKRAEAEKGMEQNDPQAPVAEGPEQNNDT